MWKARLLNVYYNLDEEVGRVKLTCNLFHTDGRNVTNEYIIWVDELGSISLSNLKTQIDADISRLDKIDDILETLNNKVGQVL